MTSQDSDYHDCLPGRNRREDSSRGSRRLPESKLRAARMAESCATRDSLGRERLGVNLCDMRVNRSEYSEMFPKVDISCLAEEAACLNGIFS